MKWWILLILFFCIPLASAATLHGTVYDFDFEVVEDVVVEIDSQPKQSMIATNGEYSFELNSGDYTLLANYYIGDELISSTTEEVSIVEEGDYVLDLILFPYYDDEVVEDFEFEFEGNGNNWWIWIVAISVILVALGFFLKRPKKVTLEKDEADDVLKFIKKEGGRTTQKDIRKNLGLSEAKASLIVTELEHKKIVKRIKKGRGNVIILNK